MYDHYDVAIIGAGIAGCGLAYNLKRIGYKGSVLVIDKEEIGSNKGYGYRNTFKEIIDEYGLPYEYQFKGLKYYLGNKESMLIKTPLCFIDYKKSCSLLLKKSDAKFSQEKAKGVQGKKLITENSKHKFKYLIDCSGNSFFMKNILNHSKPFMFWVGEVKILNKKKNKGDDYCYFVGEKGNFVKDIYPIRDKIIYGQWLYGSSPDLNVKFPKNLFSYNLTKDLPVIKETKVVLPANPTLPLVYKDYAFLGDSFGNATCISGEGIRPTLDASKVLANALKQNNLKLYETLWKKRYLDDYIRYLSFRKDYRNRRMIINLLKNKPEIMFKILRNEKVSLPKKLRKQIPKRLITRKLFNYLSLKIKYTLKDHLKLY